jgi:hypothetical protein
MGGARGAQNAACAGGGEAIQQGSAGASGEGLLGLLDAAAASLGATHAGVDGIWSGADPAVDRSALRCTVVGALAVGATQGTAAPRCAQRAGSSEPSNVVRLKHAGRDLEPIQTQRELPPRAHARYPLRPLQVHVPAARAGRMPDRQRRDPWIRYLRRVHHSPHRRNLTSVPESQQAGHVPRHCLRPLLVTKGQHRDRAPESAFRVAAVPAESVSRPAPSIPRKESPGRGAAMPPREEGWRRARRVGFNCADPSPSRVTPRPRQSLSSEILFVPTLRWPAF